MTPPRRRKWVDPPEFHTPPEQLHKPDPPRLRKWIDTHEVVTISSAAVPPPKDGRERAGAQSRIGFSPEQCRSGLGTVERGLSQSRWASVLQPASFLPRDHQHKTPSPAVDKEGASTPRGRTEGRYPEEQESTEPQAHGSWSPPPAPRVSSSSSNCSSVEFRMDTQLEQFVKTWRKDLPRQKAEFLEQQIDEH